MEGRPAPNLGPALRLFAALDGLRFYALDEEMVLGAGVYPTGNGALFLEAANGAPFDKVTVNLVGMGPEPGPVQDWFHAPNHGLGKSRPALLRLGLVEDTGESAASGFVRFYANIWRFSLCPEDPSTYAVECAHCRARADELVQEDRERVEAKEAIERLKPPPKKPEYSWANVKVNIAGPGVLIPMNQLTTINYSLDGEEEP